MAALVPDRLSAIGYRRSADRRQPMAKIFSLATSATIPELAHRRIAIPNLRRPGCPFLNHKEHQGHKGRKAGGRPALAGIVAVLHPNAKLPGKLNGVLQVCSIRP